MCSILQFPDENACLRSLLSERNYFDSLLFIFDGGRRYKVSTKVLGIHSVSDLLIPLGLGLFRSSPFWSYYLYPRCSNFNKGFDGLCGEVVKYTGAELQDESCHVFVSRSLRQIHLLYRSQGEYRLESRRLSCGIYSLLKSERHKDIIQISWDRLNELLTRPNPREKAGKSNHEH